jgi:hypothetical protein
MTTMTKEETLALVGRFIADNPGAVWKFMEEAGTRDSGVVTTSDGPYVTREMDGRKRLVLTITVTPPGMNPL